MTVPGSSVMRKMSAVALSCRSGRSPELGVIVDDARQAEIGPEQCRSRPCDNAARRSAGRSARRRYWRARTPPNCCRPRARAPRCGARCRRGRARSKPARGRRRCAGARSPAVRSMAGASVRTLTASTARGRAHAQMSAAARTPQQRPQRSDAMKLPASPVRHLSCCAASRQGSRSCKANKQATLRRFRGVAAGRHYQE